MNEMGGACSIHGKIRNTYKIFIVISCGKPKDNFNASGNMWFNTLLRNNDMRAEVRGERGCRGTAATIELWDQLQRQSANQQATGARHSAIIRPENIDYNNLV
jgi:hypothetical protein